MYEHKGLQHFRAASQFVDGEARASKAPNLEIGFIASINDCYEQYESEIRMRQFQNRPLG